MKVLFVFAHPDDELVCGWPLLQDASIGKEILICASDAHNPDRKWCSHRKQSLFALGKDLGIPCRCLDHNSGFFRTPNRKPPRKRGWKRLLPRERPPILLKDLGHSILTAIAESDCDAIFTHNLWGEYGHLDHVYLHSLIIANSAKPVFQTDMRMEVDWLPLPPTASVGNRLLQAHFHASHELDADFYRHCQAFYERDKVWTWSQPPVAAVNTYCIR